MRRIRFWLVGIVSFIITLLSEGLLRRTFAALMCAMLACNSGFGTSSLGTSSLFEDHRADATEPNLQLASSPDPTNSVSAGDHLLEIAKQAAKNNQANCSGSVRQVANQLGITLEGQQANDQVNWLEKQVSLGKWQKVNKDNAATLAAKGQFVVVGLKKTSNGHIAVVVKGTTDKGYPTVAGGSLGTVKTQKRKLANGREVIGGLNADDKDTAYSEGGLTVNYAWNREDRDQVQYYTPKEELSKAENPCTSENKQKDNQKSEECKLKQGRSHNDPHLATFDGFKYDLQTLGEFILTKSNDGTFEVQTRQAPYASSLSINSAVAIKVGSDRVALYAREFPDADTSTPLRVNGKPTNIQGDKLALPGGGEILKQESTYVISSPRGEKVLVNPSGAGNTAFFNVSPFIYNQSGQYSGLLGNVNGNPKDDLQIRDGNNVLEIRSTYGDVNKVLNLVGLRAPGLLDRAEKVYFDQLYKEFANSWRVKQEESLFDYPAGKTTKSYVNPGFPDKYLTLNMLSADQIQKAQNACTEAKVTQDLMESCIFDVGFSGFSEFARITAEINSYVDIVNQLFPGLNIPTPERAVNRVIERVKPRVCLPFVGCH